MPTSIRPTARLADLGIELGNPAGAAGSYVQAVRAGDLLFVSGQVPRDEHGDIRSGRVGRDFSLEDATDLARVACIDLLAAVRDAVGDLDRVRRVVKINAYVNAMEDFTRHPEVINGCSDLLAQVFEERGRHARAAVGVASLPGGAPLEIEGVFEVGDVEIREDVSP